MEKLKKLMEKLKKLFDEKYHGKLVITFTDGVPVHTKMEIGENL